MTIRECYEALGADFEETVGRLCNEKLVERFALKFLGDTSYGELEKFMGEGNYAEAFRAAHTLKGVSANLGFTKMYEISNIMTEALRDGNKPQDGLLEQVKEEYERTMALLKAYKEQ